MKPTITNLFAFSCLLITTSSCWTESKFMERKAQFNTSIVPADFNPKKHILLVAEMPRLDAPDERNEKVTSKLDEALHEKYPYKYEIVSIADIQSNVKYSDTSVYKYALLNTLNSIRHGSTTKTTTTGADGTYTRTTSQSARTTYVDFNFYDRVNKKGYPATGNEFPRINYVIAAFGEIIKRARP